jgi:hypothetical protein
MPFGPVRIAPKLAEAAAVTTTPAVPDALAAGPPTDVGLAPADEQAATRRIVPTRRGRKRVARTGRAPDL